jgi:hypothetical protein
MWEILGIKGVSIIPVVPVSPLLWERFGGKVVGKRTLRRGIIGLGVLEGSA